MVVAFAGDAMRWLLAPAKAIGALLYIVAVFIALITADICGAIIDGIRGES